MKISIMSRLEAIQYTYNKHNHKFCIISISESNVSKPYFCKSNNLIDVLYLHFDDVIKDDLKLNPMYKIMKAKDALNIKYFVDKYKNVVDEIIIHCHAGISRSSAIAVGICKYLGLDDMWIWKTNHCPNKWCLEVMNNTLDLGITKDDLNYRWEIKDKAYKKCKYYNDIEKMIIK